MSAIVELTSVLIESGMGPAEAAALVARAGAELASSNRSKAALRTARWRENKRHKPSQTVTPVTPKNDDENVTKRHKASQCDGAYIEEVSKKKNNIYTADDIPVTAPSDAATFATSKGWSDPRTTTEWQRFRDHALANGREFPSERGMKAAWRNWVTSPYQQKGEINGGRPQADKSASGGARRLLEKLRQFDAPLPESGRGDGGQSRGNVIQLLPQK